MEKNDLMHASMTHPPQEKPIRNKSNKFTQQEVDLTETPLFFPEGYEQIFLAIYFVSLPYIVGLMFQFFYIAESKVELFLSLNEESNFLLTWAIGYEIIAAIILLYIVKMSIDFARENARSEGAFNKDFRRP
jgi:hypothetical protein